MTKMTKKEMFAEVIAIVSESTAENKEQLVTALEHEVELLSRKRSTSRGMTATQKENVVIKERILDFLKSVEHATATEVAAGAGISQNKATALLTQLKNEEKVERIVDKKVAHFSIKEA